MIGAIVPAGGRSQRMGQPKSLLPFRGTTILHAVVNAIRDAGFERVLVVASPALPAVAEAARHAGARVLVLASETPDMRATVEQGLEWIERQWRPDPDDTWLFCPADHPNVSSTTIRELARSVAGDHKHSVWVPVHGGRRGHPVLLRWSEAAGLRAFTPGLGINSYFRSIAERVREIPVASPAGFADVDTPEDYERLKRASGEESPSD